MNKYYCTICQKHHFRGKIYEDHLPYKKKKLKIKKVNTKQLIEFNEEDLRPIARRQLRRLLKKLNKLDNKDYYIGEINRLIMYENQNH